MPVTPASYPRSGAIDGINYYAITRIANSGIVENFAYRTDEALRAMLASAKKEVIPHSVSIRHMNAKGSGTTVYQHFDPVSISGQPSGYGTIWYATQWSTPVAVSEQEMDETTTPEALTNRLVDVTATALMEHRERLLLDWVRGNALDSRLWYGLEQFFYPKTHLDSGGSTASALAVIDKAWKTRQANNTLGGITRTAHTDYECVGGTGLENLSVNTFGAAAANITYSSGVPSIGMKVLLQLIDFCRHEYNAPIDTLLSNLSVKHEYLFAVMEKTTVNRELNAFEGGQAAHNTEMLKFGSAMWACSERVRTVNDFSAISDDNSDTGLSNLYGICSKNLGTFFDSRKFEKMSPPRQPLAQHSSVQFYQTRGATRLKGCPGFRMFGLSG